MNRKEIEKLKVAGTQVAINLSWHYNANLGENHQVGRATVLEINPSGRPLREGESRWSDKDRTKKTVRVRIDETAEDSNANALGERWIKSRDVMSSWGEYQAARTFHVEALERGKIARAAKAKRQAESVVSLQQLVNRLGLEVKVVEPRYAEHATVTLNEGQLLSLIDAVVTEGRTQERADAVLGEPS